jgi:hypothetical protein
VDLEGTRPRLGRFRLLVHILRGTEISNAKISADAVTEGHATADPGIYRDGTYLKSNPSWHEEDSPWKAGQVMKMLRRHKLEPSSVGEIGCGAGGVICEVVSKLPGTIGVGYEVSPQAYELCSKKSGGRLDFRLCDLLQTEDHYDLMMALDVFEHVEDYIGFLRKLKPHGRSHLFHIPLDINVQTVLRATPLKVVREDLGHLHYFTKDTALRTLETAGYAIRDWFYGPGMLEGPPRKRLRARIAYLPRKIALSLNADLAVRVLGGCTLLVLCE